MQEEGQGTAVKRARRSEPVPEFNVEEISPVPGFLKLPQVVFKNIFSYLPVRECFRAARVCHTFEDMLMCSDMYSDMKVCDLTEMFLGVSYNRFIHRTFNLAFFCEGKLRAIRVFGSYVRNLTVALHFDAVVTVLRCFPRLERLEFADLDTHGMSDKGWKWSPSPTYRLAVSKLVIDSIRSKDAPNLSRLSCSLEKLSLNILGDRKEENDDQIEENYDFDHPPNRVYRAGIEDSALANALSDILRNNADTLEFLKITFDYDSPLIFNKRLFDALSELQLVEFQLEEARFAPAEANSLLKALSLGSSESLVELHLVDLKERDIQTMLMSRLLLPFENLECLSFCDTLDRPKYNKSLSRCILELISYWPIDRPCLQVSTSLRGCHDDFVDKLEEKVEELYDTGRFEFVFENTVCVACVY